MSFIVNTISLGTLLTFALVSGGLILFRYRTPERPWNSLLLLAIFTLGIISTSLMFRFGFSVLPITVSALISLLSLVVLWACEPCCQAATGKFACPLVPLVPMAGLATNILLVTGLDLTSWINLVVWLFGGLILYFFYAIRHSRLRYT